MAVADILCDRLEVLAGSGPIALGVSGGSDSMALLHAAAYWASAKGRQSSSIAVLTVDHCLRAESRREAARVKREAIALGFRHAILAWEGEKPSSGLAARAREARYALMVEWCRANGVGRLFVAHTLDDQAETVIMRLARGSGVDGLSAMAPETVLDGVMLVRPFLDVTRAQLRKFLDGNGTSWIDDPTNRDETYERIRVRNALADLAGLGVTPEHLASSARRLQRARLALKTVTVGAMERHVEAHAAGYCTIAPALMSDEPEEIALRVICACLKAVGGLVSPPRQSALESLYARLREGAVPTHTLGGCRISTGRGTIEIVREPGRMPLKPLHLRAGEAVVWDGRFRVGYKLCTGVDPALAAIVVQPLRDEGWNRVKQLGHRCPKPVRDGLVSFWQDDQLLAVPHLAYRNPDFDPDVTFSAEFCNLSMLEGARIVAGGANS